MTEDYAPIPRDPHGRFLPGSPGRPKGALNKISTRIAHAFFQDFEANHRDIFAQLRADNLELYVKVASKLLGRMAFVEDDELEPLAPDPRQEAVEKARRLARVTAPRKLQIAECQAQAAALAPGGPAYADALLTELAPIVAAAIAHQADLDADDDEDEYEDEEDDDDRASPRR